MKHALFLPVLSLTLAAAFVVAAPRADADPPSEDTPAAPQEPAAPPTTTTPEEAQPKAEAKASEPVALAHLKKAIERQGGEALAAGIEAFKAVFADAKFHRRVGEGEEGTNFEGEIDRDGLSVAWLAPDHIRTTIVRNGKATTRAQFYKRLGEASFRVAWLHTGNEIVKLAGGKYQKDIDQLDQQVNLVRALTDVVLLSNMSKDGSIWTLHAEDVADKKGRKHVGLIRKPPVGAGDGERTGLHLLVWFDQETYDPTQIVVLPATPDDRFVAYDFQYHEEYPTITGGGEVRFPFKIAVSEGETLDGMQKPFAFLAVGSVAFNAAAALKPAFFKAGSMKGK